MVDTKHYWDNGYFLPVDIFDVEEAESQKKELLTFLDKWTDSSDLKRPMADYKRSNFHVVSRQGAMFAHNTKILDAVQEIIGPDILCWMTEVIIKEPNSEAYISMHQDLTYWGMDNQDKQVTAWLALTNATEDNGCMSFVKGSHKLGQVGHNDTYAENNALSRGQEVEVEYEEKDKVLCALKAGQMSLHHGHIFHGSGPNKTDSPRVGIVMRFISPEMKPSVATKDFALMVRGANRQGNYITISTPDDDFSAAALNLYEEINDAQMEALAEGVDGEFKYDRTMG